MYLFSYQANFRIHSILNGSYCLTQILQKTFSHSCRGKGIYLNIVHNFISHSIITCSYTVGQEFWMIKYLQVINFFQSKFSCLMNISYRNAKMSFSLKISYHLSTLKLMNFGFASLQMKIFVFFWVPFGHNKLAFM